MKQNLIEDFYQQNKCFNSNTCYVCKRIEESKDDFTKKKIKRLKRVKDIIKHKGCQKTARIKMPVFYRTYILSHSIKPRYWFGLWFNNKIPISRVFTEFASFPSYFRISTQHYNDLETSLKKIYSCDRALFDSNKRFMV